MFYHQTISLQDRRQSSPNRLKLASFLVQEWEFYSLLIPIIFTYRYTDTEENEILNRVGRIAGFRQGTRNLSFIPLVHHPTSRSSNVTARRYFDFGRGEWRAFAVRNNQMVTITAFWSVARGEYVDTPQEALFDLDPDLAGGFKDIQETRRKSGTRSRKRKQRRAQAERARRKQLKRIERAT